MRCRLALSQGQGRAPRAADARPALPLRSRPAGVGAAVIGPWMMEIMPADAASLVEEVLVDLLEFEGLPSRDADVVAHHRAGQLPAIQKNQSHLYSFRE